MDPYDKLAEYAKEFVGTPFTHQGRQPFVGLDCIGLVVCAARRAGFNVVDDTAYETLPNFRRLLEKVSSHADKIDASDIKPGDIALMWTNSKLRCKMPHHAGIFVKADRPYSGIWLCHAFQSIGRVSINPYAGIWPSQTHSIWRLRWQQ